MDMMAIRRRVLMASKKKRLPSAYQEVEWLQADGNGEYINTDVSPDDTIYVCTEVLYEINNKNARRYETSFGARGQSFCWYINSADGNSDIQFRTEVRGATDGLSFGLKRNVFHKISLSMPDAILTIDDYTKVINIGTSEMNGTIWLFGKQSTRVDGGIDIKGYARIRKAVIKKQNMLVRNFVPCYRKSDGEIGMYDTVSKTFYTNAGTGTFLKGADV